jgi:hypothetical protein
MPWEIWPPPFNFLYKNTLFLKNIGPGIEGSWACTLGYCFILTIGWKAFYYQYLYILQYFCSY